jgi:hypothetical protein
VDLLVMKTGEKNSSKLKETVKLAAYSTI